MDLTPRDDPHDVASTQRAMIARAREQTRARRDGDSLDHGAYGTSADDRFPVLPDSFPGYEVLAELHRGAQGIVYRAVQKSTHRTVAIKVMREGPFAGPVEKARFDREVQMLGQVRHPHIVSIHGTGFAAGLHYFVMDYVPGRPLDHHLACGRSAIREVAQLFAKIADAVNAAHLRGIIHRDLKPSNIRVDADGEPRVLDFGLAKPALADLRLQTMTGAGQFVGSLSWASPEQASGDPTRIDVRTDVYSLGVMLHQALTGRFPYSVDGDICSVLQRVASADVASLRQLRSDIDDDLDTIVLKCLQKERERRYQNAGELARDLHRYLNGEPIEARCDSALYVLRKRLKKHRVFVVGAIVLLATFAIGLVTSVSGWRHAADERNAAEQSRAEAKAVADFLASMFSAPNPYVGQDPDLTVREAVDRAAARVATSFDGQPLLQATLHRVLHETYDALGVFEESDDHARAALDLRRRHLPAAHPAIAESLSACAMAACKLADYPRAEELARESVALQQRFSNDPRLGGAPSLNVLGIALAAQGRYVEAEPCFREAARRSARSLGLTSATAMNTTYRLACCILEQGRLDEARILLDPVLEQGRETLGAGHPEYANMLSTLGEVLHFAGDDFGAEHRFRQALAIRRGVFGDEHISIANSLNTLALVLTDTGRLDEAEALYRDSLDMRRRLYGPRRVEVTFALNGLGRLLVLAGRPGEAETVLRDSVDILDDTLPEHWRRSYAECLLAVALLDQNRADEGEPLLIAGVEGVRAARAPDDYFTREVLLLAAQFYDRIGRSREADPYRAALGGD